MGSRIFDLAGTIVTLAIIAVLVRNASGTSSVIGSISNLFTGSLRTAEGR